VDSSGWRCARRDGLDCLVKAAPVSRKTMKLYIASWKQAIQQFSEKVSTRNPSLRNPLADGCELDPSERYCAQKARVKPEGSSTLYYIKYRFIRLVTIQSF
jgi:hypothetical protein